MKPDPSQLLSAVVADANGNIFELDGYAAVGMSGERLVPLDRRDTVKMPYGSELMLLPDRRPIVYCPETDRIEVLHENPYKTDEPIFPVAVFNSPGYVITYASAYEEQSGAGYLPLFSYGSVGWGDDGFRSAAIQVDKERRQDLRLMKRADVLAGVKEMKRRLPGNRLREHLENCALTYGCPAGKNFFLGRYEAPLPTSKQCNARCLGCLSLQDSSGIEPCQERIGFTPSPAEIADVALTHIKRVERAVVSFGQGCEGDPLLAAKAIEPAICRIREATGQGTINMNTNGSLPDVLGRLFDAGLDSIRISINSIRKPFYDAYFRPVGYHFKDVLESVRRALDRGKLVSINYLNMPGLSDTPEESAALTSFLEQYPIHHIQWRNLNFDPVRYLHAMNRAGSSGRPFGMRTLLKQVRSSFPHVTFGYFNPPKEKWPKTPGSTGDVS